MRHFGFGLLLALTTVHAGAQSVCSRFTTGLDGWRGIRANCSNAGGAADCVDISGPSSFVAPAAFRGNWVANGCAQLCFDVRLFRPATAPVYFTISNGTDSASFATAPITRAAGWQRFCAPVAVTQNGAPPRTSAGTWTLTPGANWNALVANVQSLQFAVDLFQGGVENIRFDNICLRPVPCAIPDFTWTSACGERPTAFTDLSILAGEWLWDFGTSGVPTSTEQNPSVLLPPGQHAVTLCINSSTTPVCVTRIVRVHGGPAAPALPSQSACGPPLKYCLPLTSGVTYTWSGTNVQIAAIDTQCVRVAATSTPATLTATATTAQGCSTSTTVTLEGCPSSSSCCADPPFRVVDRKVLTSFFTDDLELEITLDVTAPYRSVTMTLVSSEIDYDPGCYDDAPTQAYFKDPRPLFGTPPLPAPPFPRELTWLYGGPQTRLPLAATIAAVPPDTAGGCHQDVRLCFKFTVVLADGKPCERIVCYTLRRDETGHTLFP